MAAAQTVPLAVVPSTRRSKAGAAAPVRPLRLAASISSTVAHGEYHNSRGFSSAASAATNASS
jgi:hypothetical protein